MLDIVVTHYTEPWEMGRKFFDMLGCQQGIDFNSIHVMLIHDGTDPFPDEYFTRYPYKVEQIRIEHGGVSAARNAGLKRCTEKWVEFCDFDDMYTNALSLKSVMDVLNTDDYDLLWGDFWSIATGKDGSFHVDVRDFNIVFVHGKIFSRKWLSENDLWFDTDIDFNEDCLFCTYALESIPKERIGQIVTSIPFYAWCYTYKDFSAANPDNWWKTYVGGYKRNKKCVELFKSKPKERYHAMVARLVWDAYHAFNLENVPDELKPYIDDFREFYKEHKLDFWMTEPDRMQEVMNISRQQYHVDDVVQGNNPKKRRDGVKIKEWLEKIEQGVW